MPNCLSCLFLGYKESSKVEKGGKMGVIMVKRKDRISTPSLK